MTRVVMEHVEYELNVPETGVQPDSLTFLRSIRKSASGAIRANNTALLEPSTGKLSSRIPSNTGSSVSIAGSA